MNHSTIWWRKPLENNDIIDNYMTKSSWYRANKFSEVLFRQDADIRQHSAGPDIWINVDLF